MNCATPYELQAVADELKRLSDDHKTRLWVEPTDDGHIATHELYQHALRLENGQELTITGEFSVRWVNAAFQGDYLQPSDPDTIEAIESINLYVARLYGIQEEELHADSDEIERLANDRSKAQQRSANTAALDRIMTVPA